MDPNDPPPDTTGPRSTSPSANSTDVPDPLSPRATADSQTSSPQTLATIPHIFSPSAPPATYTLTAKNNRKIKKHRPRAFFPAVNTGPGVLQEAAQWVTDVPWATGPGTHSSIVRRKSPASVSILTKFGQVEGKEGADTQDHHSTPIGSMDSVLQRYQIDQFLKRAEKQGQDARLQIVNIDSEQKKVDVEATRTTVELLNPGVALLLRMKEGDGNFKARMAAKLRKKEKEAHTEMATERVADWKKAKAAMTEVQRLNFGFANAVGLEHGTEFKARMAAKLQRTEAPSENAIEMLAADKNMVPKSNLPSPTWEGRDKTLRHGVPHSFLCPTPSDSVVDIAKKTQQESTDVALEPAAKSEIATSVDDDGLITLTPAQLEAIKESIIKETSAKVIEIVNKNIEQIVDQRVEKALAERDIKNNENGVRLAEINAIVSRLLADRDPNTPSKEVEMGETGEEKETSKWSNADIKALSEGCLATDTDAPVPIRDEGSPLQRKIVPLLPDPNCSPTRKNPNGLRPMSPKKAAEVFAPSLSQSGPDHNTRPLEFLPRESSASPPYSDNGNFFVPKSTICMNQAVNGTISSQRPFKICLQDTDTKAKKEPIGTRRSLAPLAPPNKIFNSNNDRPASSESQYVTYQSPYRAPGESPLPLNRARALFTIRLEKAVRLWPGRYGNELATASDTDSRKETMEREVAALMERQA